MRSSLAWTVCAGLVAACLPEEQSTGGGTSVLGDTGSTGETGTPTSGAAATTGGETTSGETSHGSTEMGEAGSTGETGETTSGEAGETTSGVVGCGDVGGQAGACTGPGCRSVELLWDLCELGTFKYDYGRGPAARFAADGSVLAYEVAEPKDWQTDPLRVFRVAPDGEVAVVFAEVLPFPYVLINETAVDFSATSYQEGGGEWRLFAGDGAPLYSNDRKDCDQAWLVPDSLKVMWLAGNYINDKVGCDYVNHFMFDEQGEITAVWPPTMFESNIEVGATGVYELDLGGTLQRRTFDGQLAWTVDGLSYGLPFGVAAFADRQIASGPGGVHHVIDGVRTGPLGISSSRMPISPHGQFSSVLINDGRVVHYADGALVAETATGMDWFAAGDVSDLGEVVVWGVDADERRWVILHDAAGTELWRAETADQEEWYEVAFSGDGDAFVVRGKSTMTALRIVR